MAIKIYTKTGDKGKTSLIGGTRVSKSHLRIEAYGTIDELNSWIGHLSDLLHQHEKRSLLQEIQDRLFTIGSSLACDPEKQTGMHLPDLQQQDILKLEQEIDDMNRHLPELKQFVLPGGDAASSACHIVRCVCRRAERICVAMQEEDMLIGEEIIPYLNRLSDYLFVLARYILLKDQGIETTWTPRLSKP